MKLVKSDKQESSSHKQESEQITVAGFNKMQVAKRIKRPSGGEHVKMTALVSPPPPEDVLGIILDMLPFVAPDADVLDIRQAVVLVQKLVLLCEQAKSNSVAEKILATMFQALIDNGVDIETETLH